MIAARVAAVREQIARAAARAGRRPEDVALVAVSKTFPAEAVREAFAAGLRVFGENKVQEAEGKIATLGDLVAQGARFHLIGHLQGNKARKAAALFDCVHSVDGADLARRLDASAAERRAILRVLVQVDLAGEATKHGVGEGDLFPTLEAVRGLASTSCRGPDDPSARWPRIPPRRAPTSGAFGSCGTRPSRGGSFRARSFRWA